MNKPSGLGYVKSYLTSNKKKAKKSLGQNFLVNEGILDKIVEKSILNKDDIVLEVGAGLGGLTQKLSEKVKNVFAVEIDKKLVEELKGNIKDNVFLYSGDVMEREFDEEFAKWIKSVNGDKKVFEYKMISNIPYNITSLLLRKFLSYKKPPTKMIIMMQKEVGSRIVSKVGKMSLLAISVQYYAVAKKLFLVSKGSFYPVPKVDSVVMEFDLQNGFKKDNFTFSDESFFRVVKVGFKSKRKKLYNNLSNVFPLTKDELKEILVSIGLDENVRAQHLSLDNWKDLTEKLSS